MSAQSSHRIYSDNHPKSLKSFYCFFKKLIYILNLIRESMPDYSHFHFAIYIQIYWKFKALTPFVSTNNLIFVTRENQYFLLLLQLKHNHS